MLDVLLCNFRAVCPLAWSARSLHYVKLCCAASVSFDALKQWTGSARQPSSSAWLQSEGVSHPSCIHRSRECKARAKLPTAESSTGRLWAHDSETEIRKSGSLKPTAIRTARTRSRNHEYATERYRQVPTSDAYLIFTYRQVLWVSGAWDHTDRARQCKCQDHASNFPLSHTKPMLCSNLDLLSERLCSSCITRNRRSGRATHKRI